MPAYNVAGYLAEAIESVLAQTRPDWRMIIVDDCSTDSTLSVAREYEDRDPRIRVMRTAAPSGGAYEPRRLAILEADTPYVAPLDADDWIGPDYLERLLDVQSATYADIVYPTMYVDGETRLSNTDLSLFDRVWRGPDAVRFTLRAWRVNCNGGIIRRSIYQHFYCRIHPENPNPFYDEVQTRHLIHAANKVVFTDVRYNYRSNPAGVTAGVSPKRFGIISNYIELKSFIESAYGHGSEEYVLVNCMLFDALVTGLRMLRHCDAADRSRARSLILEGKEALDWPSVSPHFSRLYCRAMRGGIRRNELAFRVIDALRPFKSLFRQN